MLFSVYRISDEAHAGEKAVSDMYKTPMKVEL
jgi:hypothetical protein